MKAGYILSQFAKSYCFTLKKTESRFVPILFDCSVQKVQIIVHFFMFLVFLKNSIIQYAYRA
ncbi:MAG TPA: hypothetical protein DHU75_09005 [Rikenellaceae bacterium]|nr:hypothetical protein [Rikenellaceae bacterium]